MTQVLALGAVGYAAHVALDCFVLDAELVERKDVCADLFVLKMLNSV
jgi:hypothetical protein